jgi:cytochrome c oxidase subunit 5b
MFALRRAAIKAAPIAARSTVRPFSVLGARLCNYLEIESK